MSITKPKVLMVLTSSEHGWYLVSFSRHTYFNQVCLLTISHPELAHPYEALASSCDIVVASHLGGLAPLDPKSVEYFAEDELSVKFYKEHSAIWENTSKLQDFIGKVDEFVAIFYVGGYGPMFDLVDSPESEKLILEFHAKNKIISAVCHGPAVFSRIKLPETDTYLLGGHKVTGVSDYEIELLSSGLVEPFSVEGSLSTATGGQYEKADKPLGGKVVVSKGKDGRVVITGQNPASGLELGKKLYEEIFGEPWTA